jgi:hypothetical protein
LDQQAFAESLRYTVVAPVTAQERIDALTDRTAAGLAVSGVVITGSAHQDGSAKRIERMQVFIATKE